MYVLPDKFYKNLYHIVKIYVKQNQYFVYMECQYLQKLKLTSRYTDFSCIYIIILAYM